jgi:hypothetical protein
MLTRRVWARVPVSPLGRLPGSQFTCFTSTKVQILTPEEYTKVQMLTPGALRARASSTILRIYICTYCAYIYLSIYVCMYVCMYMYMYCYKSTNAHTWGAACQANSTSRWMSTQFTTTQFTCFTSTKKYKYWHRGAACQGELNKSLEEGKSIIIGRHYLYVCTSKACVRPSATSVWGYKALSYKRMRPWGTSVWGLEVLVYEAFSYMCMRP